MAIQKRILLFVLVAALYAAHFTLFRWWVADGMGWLGYPAYEGFVGITVPHILLYSTPLAIAGGICWWLSVRAGWLDWEVLKRFDRCTVVVGCWAGLAALAVSLAFMAVTMPGSLGWIPANLWKILGNIFSNFYEEFVFRGFFLVALTAALGFWPAAIISSLAWAFTHSQFPLDLRLLIALIGVGWCWAVRRTRSLWSAYMGHEVLDVIGDSLIG